MGKTGKARRKAIKLASKRAKKAANRLKYQERARIGQNNLSKRARSNKAKNKKKISVSHPEGKCCNIGCRKCDPNNIFTTKK